MTTKKKRWAKQRHRSRKHWWFRKTGPLIRAMFRTSLLCYLWSELTEIRFVLKLTIGLTKRHANLNFEFLHSYGPFSHIVSHIYQFKWVHLCYARFFRVEFQQLLNVLYDACIYHFNLPQEVHATWEYLTCSVKLIQAFDNIVVYYFLVVTLNIFIDVENISL